LSSSLTYLRRRSSDHSFAGEVAVDLLFSSADQPIIALAGDQPIIPSPTMTPAYLLSSFHSFPAKDIFNKNGRPQPAPAARPADPISFLNLLLSISVS
jgi:hypothetical protein